MNVQLKGIDITADLQIQPITQIGGMNVIRKHCIIEEIVRYFSTYRYKDEEASVYVDGEQVGRKYFTTIFIRNKEDIIKNISMTKTSFMFKYFAALLQDFDVQDAMYQIDDKLLEIYNRINAMMRENVGNIQFSYEMQDAWTLLQKSSEETCVGDDIEEACNYDLLEILTNMVCQSNYLDLGKILLVIEDIDHLLTKEEYTKYLNLLKGQEADLWTIMTSSLPGYIRCIDVETEGVIIINEVDYCMEDFKHIKTFICEQYPLYKDFKNVELIEKIEESANYYGADGLNLENGIYIKIFNEMLGINAKIKSLEQPEIAYLLKESVV